jgi:hypothetical protein
VSATLHLEPVALRALGGVDDRLRLGPADVLRLLVEGDRGVRRTAVLADPSRARPFVGAGHGGHSGQVLDAFQGAGHRLLDVGGADAAGRGVPDDGVAVAAELREVLVQQLGGAARLGAGDLVVVRVRGAGGRGARGHPREGEEPEQNGDQTASDTPACEGCHETCSQSDFLWIFDREQSSMN